MTLRGNRSDAGPGVGPDGRPDLGPNRGGSRDPSRDGDGADRDLDRELAAAELSSTRSLWREMRDEEPPARGMSELLAAARAKAEAMQPAALAPSWWQRLAAGLRRPPALALATAVVVIGVGVIVGRAVTESRSADRAALRSEPAAKTATGGPPAAAPETTAPEAATAPAAAGSATAAAAQSPAPAPARLHAAAPPASKAGPPASKAGPPAPPKAELDNRGAPSGAGRPIAFDAGRAAAAPDLRQQCEAAAERGDCAAVRRLVEQISRSDRGYRDRLARDSAVAKCLAN